jgi:hypothetical protein
VEAKMTELLETAKLSGLIFAQAIGIAFAACLLGYSCSYSKLKSSKHYWICFGSLAAVFASAFAVWALSPLSPFDFPEYFDLYSAMLSFAVADLLALSVCISLTGGSGKSFGVPFLFILTPMILIIDKDFSAEALFALIFAIISFALCYRYYHEMQMRDDKKIHHYHFTMFLAVVICSAIPVIYTIVEKKFENKAKPANVTRTLAKPLTH